MDNVLDSSDIFKLSEDLSEEIGLSSSP